MPENPSISQHTERIWFQGHPHGSNGKTNQPGCKEGEQSIRREEGFSTHVEKKNEGKEPTPTNIKVVKKRKGKENEKLEESLD